MQTLIIRTRTVIDYFYVICNNNTESKLSKITVNGSDSDTSSNFAVSYFLLDKNSDGSLSRKGTLRLFSVSYTIYFREKCHIEKIYTSNIHI